MVKVKNTDKVFAMKILNKWEMLKRAEVSIFGYCKVYIHTILIKIDHSFKKQSACLSTEQAFTCRFLQSCLLHVFLIDLSRQSRILVGPLGLQSTCLKRHKPNVCAHKRLDVGEDIKPHTDMHDEHAVVVNTSLILFQVFNFEDGRNSFGFSFSQTAEIERSRRGRVCVKHENVFISVDVWSFL